jgi:ribosomal protein S18 acetylase RimI-like enzyme
MNYRKVEKDEYCKLATLHLNAFNDFFLTSLGERFLKAYYKASLYNSESLAVCATDQYGLIQGFCIGCVESKGYHKRLLFHNFLALMFEAIVIFFSTPKALIRLLKNLDKTSNMKDSGNYSELLSIAVSPSFKDMGVGKSLLRLFEEEARKRGCKKVALTTDCNNNEPVISFYKRSGYELFYEFTTYPNRKMYKLIKDITIKEFI